MLPVKVIGRKALLRQAVAVPDMVAVGNVFAVPDKKLVTGVLPLAVAVLIVMVAVRFPPALGVKVTSYVAVPPAPLIVVEERLLTTNSGLLDVTVTPAALPPVFVMV